MGNPCDTDREWNQRRGKGDGFPEDKAAKEDGPPIEPNYGLSGKLAEESNTVKGVVMLHAEPPEARKPGLRWRLYTFKNGVRPILGPPRCLHACMHAGYQCAWKLVKDAGLEVSLSQGTSCSCRWHAHCYRAMQASHARC